MNTQEALWIGPFGNAYTARNQVRWRDRMKFWSMIVHQTKIQSAIELGCNAGWNLLCLRELGVKELVGVDVNESAVVMATAQGLLVEQGGAEMVDCLGPIHDLTFTAGVLIHISPQRITETMKRMIAGSAKYVLAIEYDAPEEEEVPYRGLSDALWKRPYGQMYEALGLELKSCGTAEGFDKCNYWLMQKP